MAPEGVYAPRVEDCGHCRNMSETIPISGCTRDTAAAVQHKNCQINRNGLRYIHRGTPNGRGNTDETEKTHACAGNYR